VGHKIDLNLVTERRRIERQPFGPSNSVSFLASQFVVCSHFVTLSLSNDKMNDELERT
jgi:hypothetical protein